MKGILLILVLLLTLINFSCKEKTVSKDNQFYFDKGELSDDEWSDSLRNQLYSGRLMSLGELSLKDTLNQNESIRLTVFPFIYSTYCIRLDKQDSIYIISYKVGSELESHRRRSGLNSLTLSYTTDFHKMDTIYSELMKTVDALDIFKQNNSTPEIVVKKGIVGADGTDYLLEYYKDGRHIALDRWDGFLEKNFYEKSPEFIEIVNRMHSLVPSGLHPNLRTTRKFEDLRFPVFKKEK